MDSEVTASLSMLAQIGITIRADDAGRPVFEWLGLTIRMVEMQSGEAIVVESQESAVRLVQRLGTTPVVEVAPKRNAVGEPAWMAAVITPDWRGDGSVVLRGWDEIASALGCTKATAMAYAQLRTNRLPTRYLHGRHPTIPLALLQAWLRDMSYASSQGDGAGGAAVETAQRRHAERLLQVIERGKAYAAEDISAATELSQRAVRSGIKMLKAEGRLFQSKSIRCRRYALDQSIADREASRAMKTSRARR